jgi:hypothetical protein
MCDFEQDRLFRFVERALVGGVEYARRWKKVRVGSLMVYNHCDISLALFERYLPDAMAEGIFAAAPEPCVVGVGLDRTQEAFDTQGEEY